MAIRQRYAGPPYPTTESMQRGVPMYNQPKTVGEWHPTVLYLVGLILLEIVFVAIIRKFPLPTGR